MNSYDPLNVCPIEEIPLNRDIFLMGERWLAEYVSAWAEFIKNRTDFNVGYISYAAAHVVGEHDIQLSWYPNVHDRFHEMRISLPRDQIITCLERYDSDEKLHIFVKDEWLENLHMRTHSAFVLIDLIGVKRSIERGTLSKEKLKKVRDDIDDLAKAYPDVGFISFADNLLLKRQWTVGQYDRDLPYSYEPEKLIQLIEEIAEVYRSALSLDIYAVITQGINEYSDDKVLHISQSQNHISLNSLGLPFAQLLSIDGTVRANIRNNVHGPAELYMDSLFFNSLRLNHDFKMDGQRKFSYIAPMISSASLYCAAGRRAIIDNILPAISPIVDEAVV